MNPSTTLVFVHGAFAESASWDGIISRLADRGYSIIAAANPLRGVTYDTEYVESILDNLEGPIVLIGHSYGGMVISNIARNSSKIKALVYVAGFAPESGESAAVLSGRFPGSTLGPTLLPRPLRDGNTDLYIQPDQFWQQFAADLPETQAKGMAATQRPITELGLNEAASAAAWKSIPSWFIFGELDRNIPAAVHQFMAERADAKETLAISGASHVVMISHPDAVATLIDRAVIATQGAALVAEGN